MQPTSTCSIRRCSGSEHEHVVNADRIASPPTSTIHLPVSRTARIVLVGTVSEAIRELWICCHGYAQLAPDFARDLAALAAPGRLVVVPEALNRFYRDDHGGVHGPEHPVGATWMTRVERLREIDDYCAYLDTVCEYFSSRVQPGAIISALGFSQGAQTAARWAARTHVRLDHLVLWGSGLPQEIEPASRMFGTADLTLVVGLRDRFAAAGIEPFARTLDAAGVAYRVERFSGGHRLDDDTLRRIAAPRPRPHPPA